MAVALKKADKGMQWYSDELLKKATTLADKLLVAFNTSTGIPYPKVFTTLLIKYNQQTLNIIAKTKLISGR